MFKLIIICFVSAISFSVMSLLIQTDKCDIDTFYKPYVKLYRNRRLMSRVITEIEQTGFLDLSTYIDHYICVNGPAMLYRDVVYEDEIQQRKIIKKDHSEEEDEKSTEELEVPEMLKSIKREVDDVLEAVQTNSFYNNSIDSVFEYHNTVLDDNSKELLAIEKTNEYISDPQMKASVKEIQNKIRKARKQMDLTPELLDIVKGKILIALKAIGVLTEKEDPSQKILGSVLAFLESTIATVEACKSTTNGSVCQNSSTILENVVERIATAKASIDVSNRESDADDMDPSSVMLGEMIDIVNKTKQKIDNSSRNIFPENDYSQEKLDPASESVVHFIDLILKEVSLLKFGMAATNLTTTDTSFNILEGVTSNIKEAKNMIENCRHNTTEKKCKSSVVLGKLIKDINRAKASIDEIDEDEEDDNSNPLSVLFAKILYEISSFKQSILLMPVTDENKKDDRKSYDDIDIKTRSKRSTATNTTGYGRKIAIFKDAELEVYNHKCFAVNYVPRKTFLAARSSKRRMVLTRFLETIGKKIFGITLIGDQEDYRNTLIYQFLDIEFEHVVSGVSVNEGNSFVTIGKRNSWCHKNPHQDLTVHPVLDSPGEVCKRGGGDPKSDKVFPVGTIKADYNWKQCDRVYGSAATTAPIVYDRFSTMDKNKLNGEGSKGVKHPPPEVPAFIPSFLVPMTDYFKPVPIIGNKTINKTEKLYPEAKCSNITSYGGASVQKIKCSFDALHCKTLPQYDTDECNHDERGIDPCDFLDPVMNITENENTTNDPMEDIEWKLRPISLVESIFNKICKKVNPEMAPSVGRTIMWYLNKKHAENPTFPRMRRQVWDFLESELTRCEENAEEMGFTWHSGTDLPYANGRRKREVDTNTDDFIKKLNEGDNIVRRVRQAPTTTGDPSSFLSSEPFDGLVQMVIEEPLDPDNYIFPENVSVHMYTRQPFGRAKRAVKPKFGNPQLLYYFEDAAELSYDLSIPIDLHFKVFATVAGYCNLFYESRKSETFPRLLSSYYEDYLSIMDDIWLRPKDSSTMVHLFGEYLDEAVVKWMDSCLEAAYIVSKSPTYRPPRMLIIEEKGNNGSDSVVNYFIDAPPHIIDGERQNATTTPQPDSLIVF